MRHRPYLGDHEAFRASASVVECAHVREVMSGSVADRVLITSGVN